MKKRILVGALAMAFSATAFASSVDRAGQVYGGLNLGGQFNNDRTDSGVMAGVTAGYNFTNMFGAQANVFGVSNGNNAGFAEGIFNIPTGTFVTPYVAAGLGYAQLGNGGKISFDAGAGVKFDMSKEVALSVDYRYLQNFNSPQPKASTVSVGFNLFFGGASSMPTSQKLAATTQATEATTAGAAVASTQAQRDAYYQNNYVLPKGISECADGTTSLTRESIGCYTVAGDTVTMHLDAKFAYDSTALSANAKQAINNLVAFMKQYNLKKIELQGFASQGQKGEAFQRYNQQLSLRRAEAVKAYLQQQGVSNGDITVVGQGWNDPLLPNTTALNRDVNQRVQASIEIPLRSSN